MSSQTVEFEYDPAANILFSRDDFEINTEAEVDEFLDHYRRKFQELGRKAYLVACIDGLRVGAKVDELYGRRVKEVVGANLLGFARWGSNAVSRMSVRTAALKSGFEINIHNSREEAVQAIEIAKAKAAP